MMFRKMNWVAGLAAVTLLIALPAMALAAALHFQATLMGGTAQSGYGTVDYKAGATATSPRLRIILEAVQGTDSVDVYINSNQGVYVGTIALDGYGYGSLHLAARHGQDVPGLRPGDVVDIYDSYTSRVLLKGLVRQVP